MKLPAKVGNPRALELFLLVCVGGGAGGLEAVGTETEEPDGGRA